MTGTDIFISYSRDDRAMARVVATCLEREGFVVWWDAAIHSGESFDVVIERQLSEARAVVVLWSPKSVGSRWVRAEASAADRASKLVPVTIEPCIRPIIFELMHTIDLSHWKGDVADPAWEQFLLDLHRTIRSRRLSENGAADAPPVRPAPDAAVKIQPLLADGPSAFPSFSGRNETGKTAAESDEEAYEATQFSSFQTLPKGPEHFLHLVIDGRTEKQFPIGRSGLRIGRSAPAEIILADKLVSRRHCKVDLDGDQLVVTDLGSTNGTFVDDDRIVDPTVLPVGSVLKVGICELVHELRTSALA